MFIKNKLIYTILVLLISFLYSHNPTFAADNTYQKIFKIQSYEKNVFSQNYQLYAYGSAVLIEDNKVITNAHVIMNEDGEPSGYYELCKTISFKKEPECFSTLTLLYYNEDDDLAVLEINNFLDLGEPVTKSSKEMDMGDSVRIYGYPANGGETITFTEGKISGYTDGFYKVDANMDAGNSGWGAFDSAGELLGISAAVSLGYTTLGLVIPMEKVNNILSKKWNIEIYEEKEIEEFDIFIKNRENIFKNKNLIEDRQFTLSNIWKYGFDIYDIRTTLNKDLATYILDTKDTTDDTLLIIQTSRLYGETLTEKLMGLSLDYVKEQLEKEDLKIKNSNFSFKWRKADIAAIYSKDKTDTEVMLIIEIDNISYIILWDKEKFGTIKQALYLFLKELDIKETVEFPVIEKLELWGLEANLDSLTIFQVLDVYDIETNFIPVWDIFYEGRISYEYKDKASYISDYSMKEYLAYYVDVIDIYNQDIKDVEFAELRENENRIYYGYIESLIEDEDKRNLTYVFFEDKWDKFIVYEVSIDIENNDESVRLIIEKFVNTIKIEGEYPFDELWELGEIDISDYYYDYDYDSDSDYDSAVDDDYDSANSKEWLSLELSSYTFEVWEMIDITIYALDEETVLDETYVGKVEIFIYKAYLDEEENENIVWASEEPIYEFTESDKGKIILEDELKVLEEWEYMLIVEDTENQDRYAITEFTVE